MTNVAEEPVERVVGPRRVPGKPFAIAFGTFLIVGTIVFYFFARRAELARQEALERMGPGGAGASAAPD